MSTDSTGQEAGTPRLPRIPLWLGACLFTGIAIFFL